MTIDDQTLEQGLVTVRERDSMKQEVVQMQALQAYLIAKIV